MAQPAPSASGSRVAGRSTGIFRSSAWERCVDVRGHVRALIVSVASDRRSGHNDRMVEKNDNLEITDGGQPSVPVFTCLIYVQQRDDGTVAGRVANLAGIEATGNSERTVLSKLVGEFKTQVAKPARSRPADSLWIDRTSSALRSRANSLRANAPVTRRWLPSVPKRRQRKTNRTQRARAECPHPDPLPQGEGAQRQISAA